VKTEPLPSSRQFYYVQRTIIINRTPTVSDYDKTNQRCQLTLDLYTLNNENDAESHVSLHTGTGMNVLRLHSLEGVPETEDEFRGRVGSVLVGPLPKQQFVGLLELGGTREFNTSLL